MKTADQILEEMASTFRERNAVYGNNFDNLGKAMAAIFPNGVTLRTAEDFVRWHLFELQMVKLTRFANSGLTHPDSIHDAGVYAAMVESRIDSKTKRIKTSNEHNSDNGQR